MDIILVDSEPDTQDTIYNHITTHPRSLDLSSSDSAPSFDNDPLVTASRSQSIPLELILPALIAPIAIQSERTEPIRKRSGISFYNLLLRGDSQEIKKVRRENH